MKLSSEKKKHMILSEHIQYTVKLEKFHSNYEHEIVYEMAMILVCLTYAAADEAAC